LPRDFTPIGFIGEQPMFLTVDPKLGASTLPEFIALAKKQPGKRSHALRAMSPKKVLAYIQAEQQMWKPILEKIAEQK
jgi:tripartite-type tricarboxylate transporter receptor subunit TctC